MDISKEDGIVMKLTAARVILINEGSNIKFFHDR